MYFLVFSGGPSCSPHWPCTQTSQRPPSIPDSPASAFQVLYYRNIATIPSILFFNQLFLNTSCSQGGRMVGLSKFPFLSSPSTPGPTGGPQVSIKFLYGHLKDNYAFNISF